MASNRTYEIERSGSMEDFMKTLARENSDRTGGEDQEGSSKPIGGPVYSLQDALRIIQAQQITINKLSKELANRTQSISRSTYEKVLNELEAEKYQHAKTKLQVIELRDELNSKASDCEYLKNELEKERCAYGETFDLLKSKAIDEGHNSVELISKITESELKYNGAIEGMKLKEKKFSELCSKFKKKEQNFEYEIQEMNLKLEQDKYINQLLLNEPPRSASVAGAGGVSKSSKSRRE